MSYIILSLQDPFYWINQNSQCILSLVVYPSYFVTFRRWLGDTRIAWTWQENIGVENLYQITCRYKQKFKCILKHEKQKLLGVADETLMLKCLKTSIADFTMKTEIWHFTLKTEMWNFTSTDMWTKSYCATDVTEILNTHFLSTMFAHLA